MWEGEAPLSQIWITLLLFFPPTGGLVSDGLFSRFLPRAGSSLEVEEFILPFESSAGAGSQLVSPRFPFSDLHGPLEQSWTVGLSSSNTMGTTDLPFFPGVG